MATISTRAAEAIGYYGFPNLTPERQTNPEGASQTFRKGNFLVDSAGNLIIIASDNNGDAIGLAAKAGANNSVAGSATSEYVVMTPGLKLEMNLLEASDAAHVSVVADLWTYVQWQTTSSEHVLDTTSTTDRFFIVKLGLGAVGDAYGRGGIGDSNIRVFAVPLGSMCAVQFDV